MLKLLFVSVLIYSTDVFCGFGGRITTGGFVTKETYETDGQSAESNDLAVYSSRLFLNVDELGNRGQQLVFDFRDKHDFFDLLDKERQDLKEKNTFQLRQAAFIMQNFKIGRFPVLESGAAFVDGIELNAKIFDYFKIGAFSGHNPRVEGQSYLESDTNQYISGIYALYQDSGREWNKYLYWSHSLVEQKYNDIRDRLYWYQSLVYKGSEKSFFTLNSYLDYEPTAKVQNLWFTHYYRFLESLSSRLTYFTVDAIEYKRNQNLRERLETSRYQQGSIELRQKVSSENTNLSYKYIYGIREVDEKYKSDVSLGINFPTFISYNITASSRLGARKNFTSNDVYLRLSTLYSSRKFELSLDQDFMSEDDEKTGETMVYTTELGVTYIYSRRVFGVLSFQNVQDKITTIQSVLFKLTYRFGNKGIPPMRDGSSPRGRL